MIDRIRPRPGERRKRYGDRAGKEKTEHTLCNGPLTEPGEASTRDRGRRPARGYRMANTRWMTPPSPVRDFVTLRGR